MNCRTKVALLLLALPIASFTACRGGVKKDPPIHPVLDMDFQEKIKAQMAFPFANWTDGRGMRMPIAGTVARGSLADAQLGRFKGADGNYVSNPVPASLEVVERGRERFDIYCAVCHSRTGDMKGIVLQRAEMGAFADPPKLSASDATSARLRTEADGHLFETITNGRNTMPAYGTQIPVHDRWAIVHYLRVLQSRFE